MVNELNVVYATDDNYVAHMGISMLSLLDNNKELKDINFYILDNRISEANKIYVKNICDAFDRNVFFIDYSVLEKELRTKLVSDRSLSGYARIFMASLLPDGIEELLYIDCDTIICGSLAPLITIEWTNSLLAGVRDTFNEDKKQKLSMSSENVYINSGMIYANFRAWRESNIEEKFREVINKYNGVVPGTDQTVINLAVENKVILPPQFNVMTQMFTMSYETIMDFYKMESYYSKEEIEAAVQNPVIIHYTPCFSRRPWVKGCNHPQKDRYLYYKSISPWKDMPLQKDNSNYKLKLSSFLFNNFSYGKYKKIMRLHKSIRMSSIH